MITIRTCNIAIVMMIRRVITVTVVLVVSSDSNQYHSNRFHNRSVTKATMLMIFNHTENSNNGTTV